MFKRILVPTDFSAPSDAALEYARTMAAQFGASLHLLHVIEDSYLAIYAGEVYIPIAEELRNEIVMEETKQLKERLRPSDVADFRATAEAVMGAPAASIVDYGNSHGIDLIVMGTHGRGGMSHLLMGSVAERVVRTAPCPVLTIRTLPKAAAKAA